MIAQCKVSIKDFMTIMLCVKRMTQDRVQSKPDVLLHSEIKLGLTVLLNADDDKDLLRKFGIAIMSFGVLRRLEMMRVEIKEIAVNELISTEHGCSTKNRRKRFRFKMPNWLVSKLMSALDYLK